MTKRTRGTDEGARLLRRNAIRIGACAALAAFASACAVDDAPRADFVTAWDDVVPVTNAGPAPPSRLDPVVSIGPKTLTDTGSPEEFGGVTSVALGPNGNVYVADARNREVRVFGLDGSHLRTFGREGEGPGEFGSLYSLAWVGDRLLTLDPGQARIGQWSAEGQWLGQQNTMTGLTGNQRLVRLFPVGPDEAFFFTLVGSDYQRVYLGLNSRGETGDTLTWLQGPSSGPRSFIECRYDGGIAFFDIPFAPQFLQHPGPGGVRYSALSSDYRIFVTRNEGSEVLKVIARSLPAESFTGDEWRAANQEYYDWLDRPDRSGASCDPRTPPRPDRKPFIVDLFVAPDGKLWVEVLRTAGNLWEIFDADGKLLGSVPAPPRRDDVVPAFGPDYLLTIRADSLDLDHIDVWRFAPSSPES